MMTSSSSLTLSKFQTKLMNAGKKLLLFSSSSQDEDVRQLLTQMEQMLSEVVQSPSETMIKVLHHLNEALFAKELLRHPDMNVKISVACCICEIMRIMAPDNLCSDDQMKDFFEMVVITFEKLSFAYGGCYTKMTKVLRIFCNIRLAVLMLDVQAEGLIGRLFKQFLTVADSNPSAIVFKMEKIMTMILEESEERAPKLQALIVASLSKDNQSQIASPVGWQLGEKVLVNWAAKVKPGLLNMGRDMSIALYDYSKMVSLLRKAASESHIMDPKALGEHIPTTANNIKQECPEEAGNMVQTTRHCQLGSSDTVDMKGIHSKFVPKHEKTPLSISGDPPMPSKSVTRVNGKRKRCKSPWKIWKGEQGENLVGRRVKVYWSLEKLYFEGVVDSFDCSKKEHKISYDDGDEEVLDLRYRKWMIYQDVSDTPEFAGQEVAQKVSSSSVICVHGYNVKESVAPILESIFMKHGDIVANCSFKTDSIRASFLESVCDVVKQIQTKELNSTLEELECKVSDAEAANINVSWLRAHLEDMKKDSSLLMETKWNLFLS